MPRLRTGLCLPLAILLLLAGCSEGVNRTLDYAFNEDCKEFCKNTNVRLGHVTATGPNDTLHYLWDFTMNPTILIAVTSPTAKFKVDWRSYLSRSPHSVKFTETPTYIFGVVIERLLEFNDLNDRARIDEIISKTNITELNFNNFQWRHKNLTKHDDFVDFYAEANAYKDPETNEARNGTIKFLMHGYSTSNHSRIMPCMLHSENATQMDIVIDNLQTNKNFTNSRFALELLIVSENNANDTLAVDVKRKLDDEFTPGIFEIVELTTPAVDKKLGYLQWRPISYKNSHRDAIKSTSTIVYPVKDATVSQYFNKNNLLYLYYGENMFDNLAQRINISIGQKEDGYYKASRYATWTFLAGYGTPEEEKFSYLVILIITLGLFIPMLALMLVGVFTCVYRRRQTDNELIIR